MFREVSTLELQWLCMKQQSSRDGVTGTETRLTKCVAGNMDLDWEILRDSSNVKCCQLSQGSSKAVPCHQGLMQPHTQHQRVRKCQQGAAAAKVQSPQVHSCSKG